MSYNNINEIDMYIYSNMLIMNEPHTILIKAYYNINNKLYDLDFLEYDIENLSKTQIIEIYKFSDLIKEKRIENGLQVPIILYNNNFISKSIYLNLSFNFSKNILAGLENICPFFHTIFSPDSNVGYSGLNVKFELFIVFKSLSSPTT